MFVADVHVPPLSLPVHEHTVTGNWFGAVLSVSDTRMYEAEALAGLDREGFGVVSHELNVVARLGDRTGTKSGLR